MTLAAHDVWFAYRKGRDVLRAISATLEPGITAVVGPNGAGKSTLLRVLLGALRGAGTARVELAGVEVRRLSPVERARSIAYIEQRPTMSSAFTVRQVVSLGRYALGPDDAAVAVAMQEAGVSDLAGVVFGELSAGQQQRVSLARAMAQLGIGPLVGKVLLADEPLSALDPAQAVRAIGVLRRLSGRGAAVAVVLHDLTTARRAADRAIVLSDEGRVAAQGPVETALSVGTLARVFGVGFVEARTEAGVVLAARGIGGEDPADGTA
ncbi:MAG: ABC transporter ATP-binding protein [Phycisphaerales bacterium]|nr:ABC transporter ATP-binding protein [Phycisphaerales bacterium]